MLHEMQHQVSQNLLPDSDTEAIKGSKEGFIQSFPNKNHVHTRNYIEWKQKNTTFF